ncbi:MAG: hypothetical protein WA057_02235 [Candidatus Magasanikiibacteriota bacterium]
MFLQNLIPQLPQTMSETIIYVVAFLGIILLGYGIFLESERRQDVIFMLGSGSLFIYALSINNLIFTIAMAVLFLATLTEFVEIMIGIHVDHNKYDLKQIIRDGRKIFKK